jgi:hypothetical protein
MEKRRLGRSDLMVSPLCFGGNVFGWTADEKRSFELLDAAVEAGINFIDTADVYSRWAPGNEGGESETIIGKWLNRHQGGHGDGAGEEGPRPRLYPELGRGFAAPAADRLHRSLSVASGRP